MGVGKHVLVVAALMLGLMGAVPSLVAPAAADQSVVTVDTHGEAPFITTVNGVKSGFTIDILNEITARRGWTLQYGTDGTVDAEVAGGRADAAVGAIGITSDRAKTFDFSQPLFNGGLQIMVPNSDNQRSLPGLAEFVDVLLSQTMLVWLLAALAIALIPAHITWLVERRHDDSMVARTYFPGILQALGWSLGMLATQPDNFPKHWASRTLGLAMAFVSIIFVSIFTATLTANLTVDKINSQITSPSDLLGKSVCTLGASTAADYLKKIGVEFTAAPSIADCYSGLRQSNFEAVVFDAPALSYYLSRDGAGTAQLVGQVFEREDYGIAFRRGSDVRRQLDEALLGMREDGTYDLIRQKWFGSNGSGVAGAPG